MGDDGVIDVACVHVVFLLRVCFFVFIFRGIMVLTWLLFFVLILEHLKVCFSYRRGFFWVGGVSVFFLF
jgi:hypothetical protein